MQVQILQQAFSIEPDPYRTYSNSYRRKALLLSIQYKIFASLERMKVHMQTHTGQRQFKYECHLCGKHLNGSLKGHIQSHTGEKPYMCTIVLQKHLNCCVICTNTLEFIQVKTIRLYSLQQSVQSIWFSQKTLSNSFTQ